MMQKRTDLVDDVPSETKLLLTVSEAASVLGISRSVVYELLLAGKIRSIDWASGAFPLPYSRSS